MVGRRVVAPVSPLPQKINCMGTEADSSVLGIDANDWPPIGTVAPAVMKGGLTMHDNSADKSMLDIPMDENDNYIVDMEKVHINSTDNSSHSFSDDNVFDVVGSVVEPKLVNSLEMTNEGSTNKGSVYTKGESSNISFQGRMGIASPKLTDGKLSDFPYITPSPAKTAVSYL
jgi:hypothetical protein